MLHRLLHNYEQVYVTDVRMCRCPLVECFREISAAMPWRCCQTGDHLPSSAMPRTREIKRRRQKTESMVYIASTLRKASLRHDIESDSSVPDILPFQTSWNKKHLKLDQMWHNLHVLRKVVFPCESYSSLTIICLLCLSIPFQHWPLFHDRSVIHEKQPPTRNGHQLTECSDLDKNGEQVILSCEKGSEEIFK